MNKKAYDDFQAAIQRANIQLNDDSIAKIKTLAESIAQITVISGQIMYEVCMAVSSMITNNWISVDVELPRVGVQVIAAWNGEIVGEAHIAKDGKWCNNLPRLSGKTTKSVTHWQPLPEPPQTA